MNTQENKTKEPTGCRCNITFNGEELNVIIAFVEDDPMVDDITNHWWYAEDDSVFYYLNTEETEQLLSAVNEGLQGFAVDGEIEILIDSEFEFIFP